MQEDAKDEDVLSEFRPTSAAPPAPSAAAATEGDATAAAAKSNGAMDFE